MESSFCRLGDLVLVSVSSHNVYSSVLHLLFSGVHCLWLSVHRMGICCAELAM